MITEALTKFLFKEKSKYAKVDQLRYLSQSTSIEEAVAPHVVRTTLIMISIVILSLIVWSGLAYIDEVAISDGEVVPSQRVQSIQHLEGGIIKDIKVREGDLVEKDQVLIELDNYNVGKDLESLYTKKLSLLSDQERYQAFIAKRKPDFNSIVENDKTLSTKFDSQKNANDQMKSFNSMIDTKESEKKIIKEQIDQKNDALKVLQDRKSALDQNKVLLEQSLKAKKELADKGYLSKIQYIQVQQQYNALVGDLKSTESEIVQSQNAIEEYKNRLKSLDSQRTDEAYQALNTIQDNLEEVNQKIDKLEAQSERSKIKSPVHGFVKGLVFNTIGGVIDPGKVVMQVVPMEGGLMIESRISPRDIGHVKIGLDVNIKVSSYDFSRYGTVRGRLEYVSATTFSDDTGKKYYLGRISLNKNYLGNDPKKNLIMPGMIVEADIVTGTKSILSYLLRPVHRSLVSSFSER